jgi:hypothetical protein
MSWFKNQLTEQETYETQEQLDKLENVNYKAATIELEQKIKAKVKEMKGQI